MAKRKKTNNDVDLDDFFFDEITPKEEVELNEKKVAKSKTEIQPKKKSLLNISQYLVKNEIILKHIHIGSITKKKLMKSAEILGVNQYDLATNILDVFFKKYGETIKNMEEDIL